MKKLRHRVTGELVDLIESESDCSAVEMAIRTFYSDVALDTTHSKRFKKYQREGVVLGVNWSTKKVIKLDLSEFEEHAQKA